MNGEVLYTVEYNGNSRDIYSDEEMVSFIKEVGQDNLVKASLVMHRDAVARDKNVPPQFVDGAVAGLQAHGVKARIE